VQARFRLAHVLANGDLDQAWTPTAEGGVVCALKLVPGVGLFVGGDFTLLSSNPRMRVGLLDPVSGAVLPWTYNVNGGATPQVQGSTNIAVIPVSGTSFSTGGVPPGVYFVRVRAVNDIGVSPPSSEFILVVP
jgi:hypothetical protein